MKQMTYAFVVAAEAMTGRFVVMVMAMVSERRQRRSDQLEDILQGVVAGRLSICPPLEGPSRMVAT